MKPPAVNAPCHCGSGKKFKHCHGSSKPSTANVTLQPTRDAGGAYLLVLDVRAGGERVRVPLQLEHAHQLGEQVLEHVRALRALAEKK